MTTTPQARDLDLARLLGVWRAALVPVLLTAALLAALAFLVSRAQPPLYRAEALLAALPPGSTNSVINSALVSVPPVPPQVVEGALYSPAVTGAALARLGDAASPTQLAAWRAEFARRTRERPRSVVLLANVDPQQTGVYTVQAQAQAPALARALADAFAGALLDWDRGRALSNVRNAQRNLEAQREAFAARLRAASGGTDTRALVSAQGDVLQSLQQLDVLSQTISGTLSNLSSATLPTQPVAPRPLRNAALTLVATLFFGLLLASLLDRLRRRVRGPEHLGHLPPTLGTLPVFAQRAREPGQTARQIREGRFHEQVNFVHLGLFTALAGQPHPVVVVSSAVAGEGKSTLVAALADSLSGTCLIVDADPFRPAQAALWNVSRAGAGGDLAVQPLRPGLDLAQLGGMLDPARLAGQCRQLARQYDLVIVDTPPMLNVAGTLALAAQLDGLLMVSDAQTPLDAVERAVQQASLVGVPILGLVVNRHRAPTQQLAYYGTQG